MNYSSGLLNDWPPLDRNTLFHRHFPIKQQTNLPFCPIRCIYVGGNKFTWCIFGGTFDGGEGVNFGDSTLWGDSTRIKFRPAKRREQQQKQWINTWWYNDCRRYSYISNYLCSVLSHMNLMQLYLILLVLYCLHSSQTHMGCKNWVMNLLLMEWTQAIVVSPEMSTNWLTTTH